MRGRSPLVALSQVITVISIKSRLKVSQLFVQKFSAGVAIWPTAICGTLFYHLTSDLRQVCKQRQVFQHCFSAETRALELTRTTKRRLGAGLVREVGD